MKAKQPGQGGLHLLAFHHHVQQAVLQEELSLLEACRKSLTDGLLDYPGPGKADEGSRLADIYIPQSGKAGRDPAGGGIGEDRDIEDAPLVEPREGGASAIWNREKMLSCMQPPEAEKMMAGTRSSPALSSIRQFFPPPNPCCPA